MTFMTYQITRFTSFDEYAKVAYELAKDQLVYPFQLPWYQKVFVEHFCEEMNVYWLGIGEEAEKTEGGWQKADVMAVGAFEVVGDTVVFLGMKPVAGGREITDFGDIIWNQESGIRNQESYRSDVWNAIILFFQNLGIQKLQLDFVRQESPTYRAMRELNSSNIKINSLPSDTGIAPYVELPDTWKEYLADMPRKKRKELRRKLRRLEEEDSFHYCTEESLKKDFADLVRLFKASTEAKAEFMNKAMEAYYWDLITADKPGWEARMCFLSVEQKRVAAVLTYQSDELIVFVSSGYDHEYRSFAIGLMLKAYIMKQAIADGKKIADWLRGVQRYKYDLGSVDMPLYRIGVQL